MMNGGTKRQGPSVIHVVGGADYLITMGSFPHRYRGHSAGFAYRIFQVLQDRTAAILEVEL